MHTGINWKPLQRVLGVLIPRHVYRYVCALYLARPSNRPINFHQTSAPPPSRNIATSRSSGVHRNFHTWPASTWVEEGIVEAAKIGSSHLQIEFDSIGSPPLHGFQPDVYTSHPLWRGGARDKVIRYYKCITRHPLFFLSRLDEENVILERFEKFRLSNEGVFFFEKRFDSRGRKRLLSTFFELFRLSFYSLCRWKFLYSLL